MAGNNADGAVPEASRLRLAIGRVSRQIRALYTRAEADGVSFLELAVLSRLDRLGELTPTELAGAEKVTSQAIAGVVRSLEDRGMVRRDSHPTDGRRVVVAITERGRDALAGRERTSIVAIADVLADEFDAGERRSLAAVVPLLDRLAERLADEPTAEPRQGSHEKRAGRRP